MDESGSKSSFCATNGFKRLHLLSVSARSKQRRMYARKAQGRAPSGEARRSACAAAAHASGPHTLVRSKLGETASDWGDGGRGWAVREARTSRAVRTKSFEGKRKRRWCLLQIRSCIVVGGFVTITIKTSGTRGNTSDARGQHAHVETRAPGRDREHRHVHIRSIAIRTIIIRSARLRRGKSRQRRARTPTRALPKVGHVFRFARQQEILRGRDGGVKKGTRDCFG